jgi:hypothetical protein
VSDLAPAGIAALFNDVNDKKLLQTVALIDRLPRRGAIDDLLAPLRPRLSRLQPPRPLTVKRLLTVPIEELLVPAVVWRPGSLRLSRELLGQVHDLVLGGLEPTLRSGFEQQLDGCSMHDTAVILAVGRRLWPAAAEVLDASLGGERDAGDNKGRNRRQQLQIAVELLRLGPALADVFLQLPAKPVHRLDQAHARRIGGLIQVLERLGDRAMALGSEALGCRLGDAALLLSALQATGASASPLRIAAASDAAKRVVVELDETADELRRGGRQSAVALADEAVRLVGTLSALETAPADLPVDRTGLKAIGRKAGKAIEGHLQNVVFGEVLDGFKKVTEPSASSADVAAAEAAARAARRLAAAGRQLGLEGQVDLVVKTAFDDFRRGLAGPAGEAASSERFMDQLRIIEIVFGPDAAFELLMAKPSQGQAGAKVAGDDG